jgi:hypothetical protein
MKPTRLFPAFVIAAALTVVFLTAARADEAETATIKFSDPAKPGTIKVSLTNGDIHLRGTDAAEVTVKTDLKPETPAFRKDGLRVLTSSSSYSLSEKNNVCSLSYGSEGWPGSGGDFEITVPRNTNVVISSAFGGDIDIGGVTGDLEIKSLNGEVKLNDLAGGALVETMNGEISVTVRELRDGKPLSFTSMNGEVALRLPAAAKANVRLRTHNGSILTDFDDKTLVTKTESVRTKGNRAPRAIVAGDNGMMSGANAEEVRAAVRAAVRGAAEAAREIAAATRDAAHAARDAARAEADARAAARAADDDDSTPSVAPVAPVPPVPPLPPMTGGKIVTGTLNGGGPEIRVTTMNGDVTLRKLDGKK